VTSGVGIGFCKGSSFLDETFETTDFSSKSLFSSIKEIDVVSLKQQIYERLTNRLSKPEEEKIQWVISSLLRNMIKTGVLFYWLHKFFLKNIQIAEEHQIKNTFTALKIVLYNGRLLFEY
jgi:hypothetical protein